jgi:hypothetical protein
VGLGSRGAIRRYEGRYKLSEMGYEECNRKEEIRDFHLYQVPHNIPDTTPLLGLFFASPMQQAH